MLLRSRAGGLKLVSSFSLPQAEPAHHSARPRSFAIRLRGCPGATPGRAASFPHPAEEASFTGRAHPPHRRGGFGVQRPLQRVPLPAVGVNECPLVQVDPSPFLPRQGAEPRTRRHECWRNVLTNVLMALAALFLQLASKALASSGKQLLTSRLCAL